MSHYAIDIHNLKIQYGNYLVLEDINLQVEEQTIASIVGPNGSGKTTLLKSIIGLATPNTGTIQIWGESPEKAIDLGWIGYLPQKDQSIQELPVLVKDVVAMSRYAMKKIFPKLNSNDHSIIVDSLKMVDMEQHRDKHFGSLSGGQKQRVLIARALAQKPRLLILDEPSTGLDTVAQDQFYEILCELRDKEKLTILMVSHDIGTVSGIVDQIACLNRKIHFHGNPQDKIPSETLKKVFGKNIHFIVHDQHCQTCEKNQ